jgi:eukaryotic-like serine/threonine-protein kinase
VAQANLIVDPVVPARPDRVEGLSLVGRLSRGGMADIFLASDEPEGVGDPSRVVVVKRVRADLEEAPQASRLAALLVAEAKLTESLRHPNIVRVLDHGEEAGRPYIVLEHVDGLDLHEVCAGCTRRGVRFPLKLRLAVLCSVLRALDYAHRARDERGAPFEVVHRDVSPANVLIGFDGAVKLCDFGIASATVMPALDATIDGKASYMSPEHARGEAVDQRADLYACGILLWELCAGRRMRRGDGRFERAQRGEVPPLSLSGLPDETRLSAIVTRALAADPEERYPTAGAMMRDIERWCRENRMLAGESEIGRFLRRHFLDRRRVTRVLAAPAASSLLPDDIAATDCTPTHSGTRPRTTPTRAIAKGSEPSAREAFGPAPPVSWLSATPYLIVSALLTLGVLVLSAHLGLF